MTPDARPMPLAGTSSIGFSVGQKEAASASTQVDGGKWLQLMITKAGSFEVAEARAVNLAPAFLNGA